MSGIPRSYRGEILLYRDGVLFRDYGDALTTTTALGTALKAAITALTADDILVVGPGVYSTADCTVAASNVRVIANGAVISKPSGTNYSHLIKVTGDDVQVLGVSVDGTAAANTGTGLGIHVTGDRCRLEKVSAKGTRGTTPGSGDGSAVKIDDCTDTVIDGLYIEDPEYSGLWLNKTPYCYVSNVRVVDAQNRSLSINSSVALDLIDISNFSAVANTAGCKARWNTNIDVGITLRELRMTNVTLVDTDMVGAGVSYQDESSQMIKFQNIERVIWDGVTLVHGGATGAGSPAARTVYIQDIESPGEDNTPPDLWVIKNSSFSSAFVCALKLPKLIVENSHFGVRDENDYNELFYRLQCNFAEFTDCVFDSGSKTQIFELGSDTNIADRYIFKRCDFRSNSASSTYIMNQSDDEDLTTLAGCFIFDETNTLDNAGAGTMYKTNNVNGNLVLTTNATGDLLWYDSIVGTGSGQHPDATAGPTYFADLAANAAGTLIWNVNWEPGDAYGTSNQSPVKCWKSNGTSWLAFDHAGIIEASTAGSGTPNVLVSSESVKTLTNEGTTAANYHTLPTAVAGLTFTFVVQDAYGMRIVANTGDTIRLGSKVTASAGYIQSTTIGDYVTLTAINATEWLGHAYGTWTNGTFTYTLATTT